MVDQNYEGELNVITITDDDGNETYYEEDVIIPYNGKNFAVLISIPSEDEEEGHQHDEPEAIIARIEEDENGELSFEAPEDEEFDAVADIYSQMDAE